MGYALIGALLIGLVLGLIGSGGSIITVPILRYLLGHPEKIAIAESLGIVAGVAGLGALPYAWLKLIHWRSVIFFGVPGMFGTNAGAWLSQFVSGTFQLVAFAVVMLLAAWMTASDAGRAKPRSSDQVNKQPSRALWRYITEGIVVGIVTGMVGVGGGFLIIPALIVLGGLPVRLAVGTSLVIISIKSLVGFVTYLQVLDGDTGIHWNVLGLFILVGSAGTLGGNFLGARIRPSLLKRMFSAFLVLVALYVLWRELPALLGI